jgi:hypothetical protein
MPIPGHGDQEINDLSQLNEVSALEGMAAHEIKSISDCLSCPLILNN